MTAQTEEFEGKKSGDQKKDNITFSMFPLKYVCLTICWIVIAFCGAVTSYKVQKTLKTTSHCKYYINLCELNLKKKMVVNCIR